ncbi:hypothetical protein [Plantactinospora sp. KLBMP9567]|uniref:alpha/beta fold hydrolase n=1 Tax=Plantactinospora sp. KLBMP9567 TaxID=3085900 RepID=UPI002981F7A2|nr:hypothetical protein [Plantactinospora sp. KLBMP9567]MDW5330113.1 hypothetical protein [Plantactinospora sp. KLBMP9567]
MPSGHCSVGCGRYLPTALQGVLADPTEDKRAELPDWLNFAGTRDQYLTGLPEHLRTLHPPESWHLDWERMSRPGNIDAQFVLYGDHASHVARFDEIAEYDRAHQPPALVLWGRRDPYFDVDEVLAYHRAPERMDAHIYDGGHFCWRRTRPSAPSSCGRSCSTPLELIRRFSWTVSSAPPSVARGHAGRQRSTRGKR